MSTYPEQTVSAIEHLPELQTLAPISRHRFALAVCGMADGTRLSLPVNVLVGRRHRPCLLMVAGVHGNEYEGIVAQLELWEQIAPEDLDGTLVMVPVANPPAFRHKQRRNPEDMLDMNRAFPGRAEGSGTERLAYHLFHEVAVQADMVLSMHSWMQGAMVVPYVEYPRELPVTDASRAAAQVFGLEYLEAFDWHPGLLVAACARAGIPAIEPEIGGLACTLPERRALYRRGARNLMRYLGMLSTLDPGERARHASPQEVTRQELYAPVGGILRWEVELRAPVHSGSALAAICDLNGVVLARVVAPVEGFLAAQMQAAAVHTGELVAVVFSLKDD